MGIRPPNDNNNTRRSSQVEENANNRPPQSQAALPSIQGLSQSDTAPQTAGLPVQTPPAGAHGAVVSSLLGNNTGQQGDSARVQTHRAAAPVTDADGWEILPEYPLTEIPPVRRVVNEGCATAENICSELCLDDLRSSFNLPPADFPIINRQNDVQIDIAEALQLSGHLPFPDSARPVSATDPLFFEGYDPQAIARLLSRLDRNTPYFIRTGQTASAGHFSLLRYHANEWHFVSPPSTIIKLTERGVLTQAGIDRLVIPNSTLWGHNYNQYSMQLIQATIPRVEFLTQYVKTHRLTGAETAMAYAESVFFENSTLPPPPPSEEIPPEISEQALPAPPVFPPPTDQTPPGIQFIPGDRGAEGGQPDTPEPPVGAPRFRPRPPPVRTTEIHIEGVTLPAPTSTPLTRSWNLSTIGHLRVRQDLANVTNSCGDQSISYLADLYGIRGSDLNARTYRHGETLDLFSALQLAATRGHVPHIVQPEPINGVFHESVEDIHNIDANLGRLLALPEAYTYLVVTHIDDGAGHIVALCKRGNRVYMFDSLARTFSQTGQQMIGPAEILVVEDGMFTTAGRAFFTRPRGARGLSQTPRYTITAMNFERVRYLLGYIQYARDTNEAEAYQNYHPPQ